MDYELAVFAEVLEVGTAECVASASDVDLRLIQVQRADSVHHKVNDVVGRHPIPQIWRQQQRSVVVNDDKSRRHRLPYPQSETCQVRQAASLGAGPLMDRGVVLAVCSPSARPLNARRKTRALLIHSPLMAAMVRSGLTAYSSTARESAQFSAHVHCDFSVTPLRIIY